MKTVCQRIDQRVKELYGAGAPYHFRKSFEDSIKDAGKISQWVSLLSRREWQLLLWVVAAPISAIACLVLARYWVPLVGLGIPIGLFPAYVVLKKIQFGRWF